MIKHQKYTLVCLFCLIFIGTIAHTQKSFPFQILNEKDSLLLQGFYSDSSKIYTHLDSIQKLDFEEGFLLTSVDKMIRKDSSFTIHYYKGPAFKFGKITYDHSQEWVKNYLDYGLKQLEGKVLAPAQIAKLADKIIVDLENKGYPFASVTLDSSEIRNDALESVLKIDRNEFIVMDSIQNIGNAKIRMNYLYRYLDIKIGAPYDRRKIKNFKKENSGIIIS